MNALTLPLPSDTPEHSIRWEIVAGYTTAFAVHIAALLLLMAPLSFQIEQAPPSEPKFVVDFNWKPKKIVPPELLPEIKKVEIKKTEKIVKPVLIPAKKIDIPVLSTSEQAISVEPAKVSSEPVTNIDREVSGLGQGDASGGTSSATTSLVAIRSPQPSYPPSALRAREEGIVLLRITVTPDGAPLDVSVEKSSGHHALDQAAKNHVKKTWRFAATGRQEIGLLPVEFQLN